MAVEDDDFEAGEDSPRKGPSERKSRFSTPVDEDALEFIQAIEDFKEAKGRPYPSWTEVLQVLKSLGYAKVREPARQERE